MERKKKLDEPGRQKGRWGTADMEIMAPSAANRELSQFLSFKPGAGQIIALHASPTVRNFYFTKLDEPVEGRN